MRTQSLAASLFVACSSTPPDETPLEIVDQSGASFLWVCEEGHSCRIHRIAGISPPLPDCDAPAYSYAWSRFFAVAGACGFDDATPEYGWARDSNRFVTCAQDDACPQVDDDVFACRAGFCQDVDSEPGPPQRRDMTTICFGDPPRGAGTEPSPALVAALDDACPDRDPGASCVAVPSGCRDPG